MHLLKQQQQEKNKQLKTNYSRLCWDIEKKNTRVTCYRDFHALLELFLGFFGIDVRRAVYGWEEYSVS